MNGAITTSQETTQTADVSTETAQQTAEATPENLNAFQKFLNGLFGGAREKGTEPEGKKEGGADAGDVPGKAAEASFTQADLDAAVEAARKKWQDEAAEAERVGKLSPEERAADEQQKKDARIADLEKQLLRKELRESAAAMLEKDGYPVGLADLLDYSGREAMEKSLDRLVTTYKESLEEGVRTRLKGRTPEGLGLAANTQNMLRDQIAKNIRGI